MNQIEKFCKDNSITEINNIAYKNKREFMKVKPTLFLNELITPEAYEVFIKKRKLNFYINLNLINIQTIGRLIIDTLKWTSDKNMQNSEDFYIYPNEALLLKKCDCEDFAFVTASFDPSILGIAYGKLNNNGHAFNIFILDKELWCLDCTSGFIKIMSYKFAKTKGYSINYIITKDKTFSLDPTLSFGQIAWY